MNLFCSRVINIKIYIAVQDDTGLMMALYKTLSLAAKLICSQPANGGTMPQTYGFGTKVKLAVEGSVNVFFIDGKLVAPPPNNTVIRITSPESMAKVLTIIYIRVPATYHHQKETLEIRFYEWPDILIEPKDDIEFTVESLP